MPHIPRLTPCVIAPTLSYQNRFKVVNYTRIGKVKASDLRCLQEIHTPNISGHAKILCNMFIEIRLSLISYITPNMVTRPNQESICRMLVLRLGRPLVGVQSNKISIESRPNHSIYV